MSGLPENDQQWAQFAQALRHPIRTENISAMAQWGSEQDNALRSFGAKIVSPTIDPNTALNFEQRVLKPNSYPRIDNGDGSYSTHRMAWGEADGKYLAYPTIVQEGNQLKQLNDQEAFQHAVRNKEFRAFDRPEDASSYAEGGYKKFWGLGEKR
jgi:hypothetical protein